MATPASPTLKAPASPVADDLQAVAEIIKFENWLRFYFVREQDGGKLTLDVPDETIQAIEAERPDLAGLIGVMNRQPIDFQSSCDSVCSYIASRFDGSRIPSGKLEALLNGEEMRVEQQLFNLWLKGHEEMLDAEQISFAEWMTHFDAWKTDANVQRYIQHLKSVKAPTESLSDLTH